jgi:hypothetical protein
MIFTAVQPVIKDTADAARLVPVRQEEVLIAPGLVFGVVGDVMAVARDLHGAVEQHRIGVGLGTAVVEHRGEVGAAAEPLAGGYHHPGVHVHGRHMRIGRVGNQRNAGGPEPGIFLCTGNLGAEFGRELAMDGGGVDADLFEQPALHDRHGAAAAGTFVALPRGALEAARFSSALRMVDLVFECLEAQADLVAQLLEPLARFGLFFLRCRRAGRPAGLGVALGVLVLASDPS